MTAMNASIHRASCTAALLVIAIARPGAAEPIHIGFTGVVETVSDATGMLQHFNIALDPGAVVQGAYVVDAQAGVVRFGNGEQGRVPASGGDVVSGSYRSGAGGSGNIQVDLFDDCFVGAIVGHDCVPGQGADAYLLTLPPNPNVLPLETFLMLLATDEPGPLIQSETFGPIPPPLDSFSRAAFVWTFVADGDQATVDGRITSVAIVPQLSTLALVIAGLGGLGMRSRYAFSAAKLPSLRANIST
jgi:hypothetical protein